MYIQNVYLSTYSEANPLSGHLEVQVNNLQKIRVELTGDEAKAIQAIGIGAYLRSRQSLVDALMQGQPSLVALPAPEQFEDAEIEECF